jgi:hypothetical protein
MSQWPFSFIGLFLVTIGETSSLNDFARGNIVQWWSTGFSKDSYFLEKVKALRVLICR